MKIVRGKRSWPVILTFSVVYDFMFRYFVGCVVFVTPEMGAWWRQEIYSRRVSHEGMFYTLLIIWTWTLWVGLLTLDKEINPFKKMLRAVFVELIIGCDVEQQCLAVSAGLWIINVLAGLHHCIMGVLITVILWGTPRLCLQIQS